MTKRFTILKTSLLGWFLVAASLVCGHAATLGNTFTYQGRLTDGGAPANGAYDLTFTLYDAAGGGATVGTSNVFSALGLTNGLFTVALEFGGSAFEGSARWLEIALRPAGAAAFTNVAPRQAVTATPYALHALSFSGTLGGAQLAGTYGGAINFSNAANLFGGSFSGNGDGLTNLNAASLTGPVPVAALSNAWRIDGNNGTLAANNFLGTTDNQPLELRVNNARAFRLQPDTSPQNAPNIIGGSPVNLLAPGIVGATIAGGGSADYEGNGPAPNTVGTSYGTVGGGVGNDTAGVGATVSGGYNNTSRGLYTTVVGGSANLSHGDYASVGGGLSNQATNTASTVAGGRNNVARGRYSSVGGGTNSQAVGDFSTVAGGGGNVSIGIGTTTSGGRNNRAQGRYSSVGGGTNGLAVGEFSTIGGGMDNDTLNDWATVGGGRNNGALASGSTVSGGRLNFAYGSHSTIGGGTNGQALGGFSTIGGGAENIIRTNAPYATIPGGHQAAAASYGQLAYASGHFANPGDAQASVYVVRITTSTNNESFHTELFLDGVSQRIRVPRDSAWAFDIVVVGRNAGTSSARYHFRGLIENNGGVTEITGPLITENYKEIGQWNVQVVADDDNDALVVRAVSNGWLNPTDPPVRWVATVRTTEVVFP